MDKILLIKEVMQLCRLSKSAIYQQIREGEFPNPISLSKMRVGWKEADIEKWIESREPKLRVAVTNCS
jgi:prophage regulatory protein